MEAARGIATAEQRGDINQAIAALPGNNALLGGKKLAKNLRLTPAKKPKPARGRGQDNNPNFSTTRPQPQPKPHTAAQLRALRDIDKNLQFTPPIPPILPRRRS